MESWLKFCPSVAAACDSSSRVNLLVLVLVAERERESQGSKSISKATWKWSEASATSSTYFVTHQGETSQCYDFEPCREPSVTMLQAGPAHNPALKARAHCAKGELVEYITRLVFTLCYKYRAAAAAAVPLLVSSSSSFWIQNEPRIPISGERLKLHTSSRTLKSKGKRRRNEKVAIFKKKRQILHSLTSPALQKKHVAKTKSTHTQEKKNNI